MKLILSRQEKLPLLEAMQYGDKSIPITIPTFDKSFCIEGSEEEFLALHEVCQDYLLFKGFDEQYTLTSEGEILEELIDKIFLELEINS